VLLGFAALAGAGRHLAEEAPPDTTLTGLAALLGRASGGSVNAAEIAWEPSPGFLREALLGRHVLFLSRKAPGEPRDLFRARVRVTRAGQIVAVRAVRNLTETPLGDDMGLSTLGSRASFATLASGEIQGISVLELPGIRPADGPESPLDRALLALRSLQQFGSLGGIGRTDILFDAPLAHARLALDTHELRIAAAGAELVFELDSRKLRHAGGGEAPAARAVPQVYPDRPLLQWLQDLSRAEVRTKPIAWLAHQVCAVRDAATRAVYAVIGARRELDGAASKSRFAGAADGAALPSVSGSWPPPDVPSIWKRPDAEEGRWAAVTLPFLAPLLSAPAAEKPPPYFYRARIRPDAARPYSEVVLVAMDMRQLELGVEGGRDQPKSHVGPPGEGRFPGNPATYRRIVAAFNGGIEPVHGAYGMMVRRRVLLPPQPGAPSIVITRNAEVLLGTWPSRTQVSDEIDSFRQSLGAWLPGNAQIGVAGQHWSTHGELDAAVTRRSALCVTAAGHLYYAWGSDLDAPALAAALRQAGCAYGVRLDMHPAHTGFAFIAVRNAGQQRAEVRLAASDMHLPIDQYLRGAPEDFFYLSLRDPRPPPIESSEWVPDDGAQPSPAWLTGIHRAPMAIGEVKLELKRFQKGHFVFRLRAGSKEPGAWSTAGVKFTLDADEKSRALAAIGLGHATAGARYGLSFNRVAAIRLRGSYATLTANLAGDLRLDTSGESQPEEGRDAVQLPLLARSGSVEARARERGDKRRRGALCVHADGSVIVALGEHDSSDAHASALLRLGCLDVVELDRGSRHPAFVHRSGTATPPLDNYEASTIYALPKSNVTRAFHWKSEALHGAAQSYDMDSAPGADLR
jgi:hypothetical protein